MGTVPRTIVATGWPAGVYKHPSKAWQAVCTLEGSGIVQLLCCRQELVWRTMGLTWHHYDCWQEATLRNGNKRVADHARECCVRCHRCCCCY
jgi:hypothetical protein